MVCGLRHRNIAGKREEKLPFSAEDIPVLAKALGISIAKIYNKKVTNALDINLQSGGHFEQGVANREDLIKQYEARLKEKDEAIAFLRKQLKDSS